MTNNFLICFDHNYKDFATTMLNSLCIHNRHLNITVHCFTRNISEQDFQYLHNHFVQKYNIAIINYSMDYNFAHYHNELQYVTVSTMDRLLVANTIRNPEVDRIIYLDIDLLILDKLDELFSMDTGNKGIGARDSIEDNVVLGWLKRHPDTKKSTARYFNSFKGFNAGVLVMDLDKMRKNDFTRLTKFYYNEAGFNDQIILNLYANEQNAKLEKKYNVYVDHEDYIKPTILHFVGKNKPWNDINSEHYALWCDYSI